MELEKALEVVRKEAKKQFEIAVLSEMCGDKTKQKAYADMADALETLLDAARPHGKRSEKLVIPGTLPGLNEYIEAERVHRQKGASMKREAQRKVEWCAKSQLRKFRPAGPVWMKYTWYEPNRRRDKDNVSSFGRKVIQDGLVKVGVLENDGWKHIEVFSDRFRVDGKNPRVEVEIIEVET